MIYGVVGTLDRDTMMKFGLYNMKTGRFQRVASKKGNGKTLVLTYYGYREKKEIGRKVYSNYHTKFSEYKTAQEIFNDLGRLLDLAGKFGGYGTITEIIKNFDYIMAKYSLSQQEQTELYEIRTLFHKYFGSLVLLTEFQKFFNSLGTSTKTIKWIEGILTQLRKLEMDVMWDSQRPISAGNRSREYTETFLVPQKFHADDLSPCDMDNCNREHLIYVYSDIPFRENPLVILVASEVGQLYDTNEIIGDNLSSPGELQTAEKAEKKKTIRKRRETEAEPPVVITNAMAPLKEEEPDPEILDQISYVPLEDEPPEMTLEEKLVAKISTADHIPEIIKRLLPQYIMKNKVVGLYMIYFNEDGTPRKSDSTGTETVSTIEPLTIENKVVDEDPLAELFE